MKLAMIATLADNFMALSDERRSELLEVSEKLLRQQKAKEMPADLDHQQA